MGLSKDEWIDHLDLVRHPDEGGYYASCYVSQSFVLPGGRHAMDTIYYMLTADSPVGHFHMNQSDIVHFYHAGSPLRYTVIGPDGRVATHYLGPDPRQGHVLQLVVSAGHWKATELTTGAFGLLSEAVTPAFNVDQRVMATRAMLADAFPELDAETLRLAYE